MKVEDLGLGQVNQYQNSDSSSSSSNRKMRFFNLLSLFQLDSQKYSILSFLAMVYSLFQNVFISFWPHLDLTKKPIINKLDYIRIPLVFEENLTNAFFLYSTDREPDDLYTFSFLIFLPSMILFFLSLACFCLYYFKRIVNYRLIHSFSIFTLFICPIITVPLGFQIGWLISKVSNMKNMLKLGQSIQKLGSIEIFTAIIILNFILYIIDILITILINVFNSNSIIIINSYFSSYNGYFQSFVQLFPSVILLFSNILPLFHKNTRYFIVLFHMIYCICSTIGCFWLPYGHVKINSLVASISLSMLISDFICFTKLNTKWYRYLIIIGSFIILFFFLDFFIKLRIKFIFKKYRPKEIEEDDENNSKNSPSILSKKALKTNQAAFNSYNDFVVSPTGFEDLSINQALYILRVALITKNRVFLDGRLIELIAMRIDKDQDKIQLASLICYFPEFQPFFFAVITGLKKIRFLPILKDFQLFQIRCYDTSCHIDSKVDQVKDVIHESSALSVNFRSFWQLIDSECESKQKTKSTKYKLKINLFSIFDRFSRAVNNCKNKWESILSIYPNNIEIADEYSKFLIEFCGDFIGASEWKTASSQMKEGKIIKYNPFIISFLKAYPFYFHQIIEKQSLIKNFDDIDIYKKIENVGDLIEMPEARFEFQRSARSSYPFSITAFLFISIIPLFFIIGFWIAGFYSFGQFEHIVDGIYYVINTGFLGQQISKNFISAILDYGQLPSVGLAPTPDEIFSTLYENNESDRFDTKKARSLIPITGEYKSSLSAVSERGMGLIDWLHNSTLEQIEKKNNFQIVLDNFYSNTLESTYYLSKDKQLESTSNLQSLLISFFTYYFTMSYDYNYTYVNDTECYHATKAGAKVLDQLDIISQATINNSKLLFNNRDSFYSTGIYALSAIYIIISCIFPWIDFFFMIKSFKKICDSLCYFPKIVKEKASNPIFKDKSNNNDNSENSEINQTAINNMKSKIKNFVIIWLVVVTIFNIGLGVTILSFHFYYEKYRINLTSIFELTHYYSIETAQVIEVLFSVMAASTFGKIVPSTDLEYKKRLTATIAKFENTHLATGAFSFEGECGIRGQYLDILNNLKTQQKCSDYPDKTQHELLSCLSEESMVNAYIDLARNLEDNIEDTFVLKSNTFKIFIHYSLSHVYYEVRNFGNYLTLSAQEKLVLFANALKIFGSISIAVDILLFFMNIIILIKIRAIFKILFVFISRVLPSDIVKNSELLSSLFGIKNLNKVKIENSGASFIFQETSSPIVFIDRSALIQFVNTAFTRTFGIEANFIVGQSISRIIPDEEVLLLIDTLKFFGTKKIPVKTVKCVKRNGNSAPFEVSLIPINESPREKSKKKVQKETNHNDKEKEQNKKTEDENDDKKDSTKNTFINQLAIVFVDKTTKKNLKKKCKLLQSLNQKLINSIFPSYIQLFYNGYFRICAICLIKFPNISIKGKDSSKKLLLNRQNMFQLLYDKLSIFPLLSPLECKNGIFAVVGCKKNDPTELAIECLNFVFNVIDELAGIITRRSSRTNLGIMLNNNIFAVVETGGELKVGHTGDKTMKTIVTGELMSRAIKVLDYANSSGNVCVSATTYEYIMQHDCTFHEKKILDKICGKEFIYAVSGGVNKHENYFLPAKTEGNITESDSNCITSDSLNFIGKMKEDETTLSPSDE